MEKFIVANWKANLTHSQSEKWLDEFGVKYQPTDGIRVILAVPLPVLFDLKKKYRNLEGIAWAAQDVSQFPLGRYTGSIPAAWINGIADYALVGHQERRTYFHETLQDVANKVYEALEEEITPIVCVDLDFARQQAASLEQDDFERIVIAYTPADAEKLEISRTMTHIADKVAQAKSIFPGSRLLYGGGVNENNVSDLLNVPGLDGVMVAGGCLDPVTFVRLLDNAS